jgi:hypothetical protein
MILSFELLPGTFSELSRAASLPMICAALCLALPGCSEPRAEAVDVDLARSTLVQVLEHWKNEGTIDDLRAQSPEIVVQEAHWTNGRRLQNFSLLGDGNAEDANWFCEVELTLTPEAGDVKAKTKTVTYVVGTDPVLTVFRAIL